MSHASKTRALAGALLLAPLATMAHTGAGDAHVHGAAALAAGFAHPFSGFDHLAAMLALGVWSGVGSRAAAWRAPLAFAAALLAGALMALAGLRLPAVEPMIAASVLVLGLALAGGWRQPAAAGVALAAGFALFHGAAHGQELAGPGAALALAGMVLATAVLHAGGIALGRLAAGHGAWAARVAGAAAAVFGLGLVLQLA